MRFGSLLGVVKLGGMDAEPSRQGSLMTRHRLAEIVDDMDRTDPGELEALLAALTTAAWPTRFALDN